MRIRTTLATLALAVPLALAGTTTAWAGTPGDLGDATSYADRTQTPLGKPDGNADIWVTIDDHKYTTSASRNGLTELYTLEFPGNETWEFLKRQWYQDLGLGSASAMSPLPDVSGDHRADMLVRFADRLFIYRSDANGKLSRGPEVGHGWGSMDVVTFAGHLNGDARNYLLARRSTDGTLWAYTISNSGAVAGVGQVGHGWNGMRFLLGAGQMVGDAKSDFVGIDQQGRMWCYRGTGGGAVAGTGQCGHGWTGFRSVFIAGDMTQDGRWDMVGVKEPTHPNANGEPIIPAGQTLSDLDPVDRSPMYLYRNHGDGTWSMVKMIGYDMFQFRLFA